MLIRRVAATFTCLAVGVLLFAAPASAAMADVQTPTVTGPIADTATSHPFGGTDIDLSKYGYVEQEFYVAGNAFSYDTTTNPLGNATKLTTGPNGDGSYPYVTRITVRRPISPAAFNGVAVVEWNNVTATFDLEANWDGDPYYLLKHGYAWVGVSTQRIGVNSLKALNPARYGGLDIPNPNSATPSADQDALSYEVYSAAIKAVLGGGNGVDPMGGLNPQTIIASGESQSGSRLSTYYNTIQPLHELVNAFLLTVSTRALRTDRPEKVIRVLSENENKNPLPETDNDTLRHWEVAGASHLPQLAYRNFQVPVERDLGFPLVANCDKNPLSHVQWPFVVNTAISDLVSWSRGGPAPPVAARGDYTATSALVRDSHGIAAGGIRLPEVTVPVATNTGINTKQATSTDLFSNFCPLLGSYEIFPQPTIDSLYSDFGDYIDKVTAQADAVSAQGFVLPEDVARLVSEAEQFPQIRPEAPVRVGKARNRGTLGLKWRGTQAPATTFELQHSKAGTKKWSTVPRASALTGQTFAFTKSSREKDGKWRYRVRSTTTVPATPIAAAYVVTTSYSDAGGAAVVDRTKPKIRVTCPKKVRRGEKAFARVTASDATSGLRHRPKRKVRIATGKLGKRVIKRTVSDKLGNKATDRCVTHVVSR